MKNIHGFKGVGGGNGSRLELFYAILYIMKSDKESKYWYPLKRYSGSSLLLMAAILVSFLFFSSGLYNSGYKNPKLCNGKNKGSARKIFGVAQFTYRIGCYLSTKF